MFSRSWELRTDNGVDRGHIAGITSSSVLKLFIKVNMGRAGKGLGLMMKLERVKGFLSQDLL